MKIDVRLFKTELASLFDHSFKICRMELQFTIELHGFASQQVCTGQCFENKTWESYMHSLDITSIWLGRIQYIFIHVADVVELTKLIGMKNMQAVIWSDSIAIVTESKIDSKTWVGHGSRLLIDFLSYVEWKFWQVRLLSWPPFEKSAWVSLATESVRFMTVCPGFSVWLDPVGCPRLCLGYCQPFHVYTRVCSVLFGTSVANTVGGNRGHAVKHGQQTLDKKGSPRSFTVDF